MLLLKRKMPPGFLLLSVDLWSERPIPPLTKLYLTEYDSTSMLQASPRVRFFYLPFLWVLIGRQARGLILACSLLPGSSADAGVGEKFARRKVTG